MRFYKMQSCFISNHKTSRYYHLTQNSNRLFDWPKLFNSVVISAASSTDRLELLCRHKTQYNLVISGAYKICLFKFEIFLRMGKIGQVMHVPNYIHLHKFILEMNKNLKHNNFKPIISAFWGSYLFATVKSSVGVRLSVSITWNCYFGRYHQKSWVLW